MEALLPGGERLHAPTIGGMAIGLLGACLLFTPDPGSHAVDQNLLHGFLLLQFGMAGLVLRVDLPAAPDRQDSSQSSPEACSNWLPA